LFVQRLSPSFSLSFAAIRTSMRARRYLRRLPRGPWLPRQMRSRQNGQSFKREFLPTKPCWQGVDLVTSLAQPPRSASCPLLNSVGLTKGGPGSARLIAL
jgi:hypothetical protein